MSEYLLESIKNSMKVMVPESGAETNIKALDTSDNPVSLKCTDNGELKISGTFNSGNIVALNDLDQDTALKCTDNGALDVNIINSSLNTSDSNTQSKLDTVNSNLGAIETDIESTNTKLDTVNSNLGAIETDIESTNTKLDTIETSLNSIQTAVETLDNAISGNEMQVDIVSSLPAGTNAIGKLTSNSGIDIGDVDVLTCGTITPGTGSNNLGKADDIAHISGDVGVMSLAVRNDTIGTLVDTNGDYTPLQVNNNGALYVDGSNSTQPVSGSVSVSNFPASQAVTGDFYPETQPVSGSVSVSNFPTTQPVSGSVSVSNFPASQAVTGDFYPETQPVSGSVSVSNFPTTQPVSGSVSVSNFPTTQPVSGSVSVSNFPASQAVTGDFYPETQPVSGSVSVSNFPTTQPVSGSVSVSNFPASQAVTGDFYPETQPVSGSVSVSNFPTTQPVSGSVSVSNFPTTQPVSGSVSVSNFPASQAVTGDFYPETQPVSGSVSVSNFPASQAVTGDFYPETQPVSGSVSVSNFPTTQPVSGSVSVSNHPTSIQVSNLPATQQVSGSVSVDNQITGYATQATLNEIKQKIDLLDGYLLELRNYKWRLSPIYQKGKGNCYQIMDYWYGDANRTLYVHNPVASTKTLFIYNIEYSLGYSDSADHRGTISYGIGYNTFTARSSRNQVNLKTAGGNIDDNTMAGAYQGTESDIYSGTNLLSFHYVQAGGTDTKTIDFQEEHGLMIEPGKGFWIKGSEIGSSNPYFTICVRYMRVDTADLPADWTI
jgi:prefoldin subunit 5